MASCNDGMDGLDWNAMDQLLPTLTLSPPPYLVSSVPLCGVCPLHVSPCVCVCLVLSVLWVVDFERDAFIR